MLISCKISHSIILSMESRGEDLGIFFESLEVPVEFLRDPTHWIEANKIENFLERVAQKMESSSPDIIKEVAKTTPKLRSWGVLDSVLKLMESPEDIFCQPARFISYFISPQPPVGSYEREGNKYSFQIPVTSEEYPRVTSFLCGVLESLPLYMGKSSALVSWEGSQVCIEWFDAQESLLQGEEKHLRKLDPSLVQTMMDSLQREQSMRGEGHTLDLPPPQAVPQLPENFRADLKELKNDFYRMYDYFTRAQQLVTLLVGQGRMDRQVKQAMKRVDWDVIRTQFGEVVESACQSIESLSVAKVPVLSTDKLSPDDKVPTDLNEVVKNTLSSFENEWGGDVQVDTHLMLDRKVEAYPKLLEKLLGNLLEHSSNGLKEGGQVRIVTRPNGKKAEIEISDTGGGISEEELVNLFQAADDQGLSESKSIIYKHDGNISVSSQPGRGSTYLIELPL